MAAEITHDTSAHRFTYERDGLQSYLQYQVVDDRTVDFLSTYTPPALRGRGIAARIVDRALRWADESGYKVIPTCWFVAAVIERQPEWRRLLAS